MINADTGGRTYVTGSSMAIVAIGPMPGRTPMSVPMKQPINAYIRLTGVRATPKPRERFANRSIPPDSSTRDEGRPYRDLQVQQENEGTIADRSQHGGQNQRMAQFDVPAGQAGDDGQHVYRCDQPCWGQVEAGQTDEENPERHVGGQDEKQRLPGPRADAVFTFGLQRQ